MVFTAVIASSGADAATKHHHAALAGAHNGPSEEDTRNQCLEEARTLRPSRSWDMQANRDAAAQSRMFDHGLQYP